jgi:CheY-like chemotaxis protein
MPAGGIMTIEAECVRLTNEEQLALGFVGERVTHDFVVISVSDTGIGMDERTLSQAFDPFFTTKDVGKGSGLGLSMVYGFIAQLDGHVHIKTELGRGTTVEMYLPLESREEMHLETEVPPLDARGGDEKILIVEDDELVRTQVTTQLSSLGYRIVAASDGIEALEILKANPDFDLLFTDMMMPRGMSGLEVANRAHSLYPDLPVLFTSGYAEGVTAQARDSVNRVELLAKPYRPGELASKVRTILDRANRLYG